MDAKLVNNFEVPSWYAHNLQYINSTVSFFHKRLYIVLLYGIALKFRINYIIAHQNLYTQYYYRLAVSVFSCRRCIDDA